MKDASGGEEGERRNPSLKKKKSGLNLLRLAIFILRIKPPSEKSAKESSRLSLPTSSSSAPPTPPPRRKSRHSSAAELRRLAGEDSEEEREIERANSHSIDHRAEEFIARFYEQMRLQKSDSFKSGATSS